MIAVVLAVAVVATPPAHPLAAPWQPWRDVRSVVPTIATDQVIRFAIPADVYGKSEADLGDLRVIDASGAETPYAVDQRQGAQAVQWVDAPLSEQGFVPGRYTQAVADLGATGALHNEVTLDTTADEFSAWVEVAASSDERTWRIVRQRAPIYRFSSDGLQGNLIVRFDATRDRWLRVRVQRGAQRFPISGCRVADDVSIVPELSIVASHLRVDANAPARQTRLTADFGSGNIPVSAVRFAASSAEFYRTVEVSVSDDGETWNDAGQGDIYRDPRAGTSLTVQFAETRGRYWRVVVYNRNDRPLAGLDAALLAVPRYVSFRARALGRYRVLYGNPAAQAPEYDFSKLTTADERLSARVVALGPEVAVPPTVPWTESHPFVLWLALLLAVGILAWLAVGAMRSK